MPKKDLIIIIAMTLFVLALAGAGVGVMVWQHGGFGDKPEDAPKFAAEADAARVRHDYQRAITLFDRALAADPAYVPAHIGLASTHAMMGDFAAANEGFRAALALDPENIDAHIGLAHVAMAWGDSGRALEHYNRAIEIAPNDPALREALSATFYGMGASAEAIGVYDSMIESGMADERIYAARAAMRVQTGDLEGAIEDLTSAIDMSRYSPPLLQQRGDLYQRLGAFESARDDFEAVYIVNPADAAVARNYAWALWGLGEREKAAEILQKTATSGYATLHDHFSLGATYMQMGRYDDAKPALERAIAYPAQGLDYASLYLWITLAHLGDREEGDRMLLAKLDSVDYRFRRFADRIARYFLNEIDESAVLEDMETPNVDQTKEQKKCEGYFYLGAKHLIEGERDQAIEYFEECVATNVRNYYEWNSARAELQRASTKEGE